MIHIEVAPTRQVGDPVLGQIRDLMDVVFEGEFTDDDWAHSLGGWHAMAWDGSRLAAHASLVERRIHVADAPLRAGYVEAVGTEPNRRGQGLGGRVMHHVGALIVERFEIGVLSTGATELYERLGWERWHGPSYVRHEDRLERTSEEDDGIMVLRTQVGPRLDLTASIACQARSGDDW